MVGDPTIPACVCVCVCVCVCYKYIDPRRRCERLRIKEPPARRATIYGPGGRQSNVGFRERVRV